MLYFLHSALISQQGVRGSRGKRGVGTRCLMVFTPPCCSGLHKALSPPVKRFASQRERLSVWWVWMFTRHRVASGTNRCARQNTAHTQAPLPGSRTLYSRDETDLWWKNTELHWDVNVKRPLQGINVFIALDYAATVLGGGRGNVIWGWQMYS